MKKTTFFLILFILFILINNFFSVANDSDLTTNLFDLKRHNVEKVGDIKINTIFSNSFFFTSSVPLEKTHSNQIFRIDNHELEYVIYFKVNTIKTNDSLYFFQHIEWLTKKTRKIDEGVYTLNKIVNYE